MESPFFTLQEAAKYLRVSSATVAELIQNGSVPAAKIGGKWRIHKHLLNQFWYSKFKERQEEWEILAKYELEEHRYCSPQEAARRLRLPIQYGYHLVYMKDFPAIKVESQWRIREDLLEKWLTVNMGLVDEMRQQYNEGVPGDGRRGNREARRLRLETESTKVR